MAASRSEARLAHRRRVTRVTVGIAACAAAATALFAGMAAHSTRGSSGGTADSAGADTAEAPDDAQSFLTPSQSSPSQSLGPPVARSGGS